MVDFLSADARFRTRWPYSVSAAFGKGWDDLKTLTSEFVDVARARSTAGRQIVVSNQIDFFEEFERRHGKDVKAGGLSFGNEWDTYSASMAEVTARVRRAVERLRGAEAMAALVERRRPGFWKAHEGARAQAMMGLGLYWEHDWTADGRIGRAERAAWQRRTEAAVTGYVDALHRDAVEALSGLIRTGAGRRFFVFNPLGFVRTDFADLPDPGITGPLSVVDATTGAEVPWQLVTLSGQRRLRIHAEGVPPVGYKVYEVRPVAGQAFPPVGIASAPSGILENDFYRIMVSPAGALTSLLEKRRNNRQLVRAIGGRTLNDLGGAGGTLSVVNQGPVSLTLEARSQAPLRHTSRVTLYRGSDRIDLEDEIEQGFSDVRTLAFGFNLDNPQVMHEEVGAVMAARLEGQGGRYSATQARYDFLTLGHFADISSGGVGVTLSNWDTAFMKLGASTAQSLDVRTPQISPLLGGQVDGPSLGIPAQGGDSRFLYRFALRSHDPADAAAAMRFALAHQNPLIAAEVRGGEEYPEDRFSLLSVSDDRVLLWALKPAEEGIERGGLVVRLWNLLPADASVSLDADGGISAAQGISHIETPQSEVPVADGRLSLTLRSQQLATFALWTSGAAAPPVAGGGGPQGGDEQPGSGADSGCACRAAGPATPAPWAAGLALLVLAALRVLEKRRRMS